VPAPEPPHSALSAASAPAAPRAGIIIDPATMPPDDPGPGEGESEDERRDFHLYAGE
jgi:hypothetical protein